ncbi:MAG TPA: winged helix-turn-helix domain-containing protein, partial [Solirubrobacteraceae bacterium]
MAGERREDAVHGRQGRLALACLVLNRDRPLRRDELLEALWSGEGAPPSDSSLPPVLSRLRRALAPATIDGRDALALTLPEPAWVDVEAARDAVTRARGAARAAEALAAAQAAVALVEPGLLPGLEAPWIGAARAAIEDVHVEALELVARAGCVVDPALAEAAARDAVAA